MTEETQEQVARRWKNRRRIAYCSVIVSFIVIGFYLNKPELFKSTESIYMAVLAYLGSIVGAYQGFSYFDDKRQR